jgi:hypothetical protein
MSNSGMITRIWGGPAWLFLHSIAAGYPVNPDEYDIKEGNGVGYTRKVYKDFFTNTGGVLPCGLCRKSYIQFIKDLPIDDYIHSRESLFEWLFIIHNKVNDKLGVPQEKDLSKVVAKYECFRAKCSKEPDAKGCIFPAKGNVRMKCRLVIEPVNIYRGPLKFVAGSIVVLLATFLIVRKSKSVR